MNSWRSSTKAQYEPYLKKWFLYANKEKIDAYNPALQDALTFLSILFNEGQSYNQINTARCALSTCIMHKNHLTFGKLPIVKRFMKGVYESKPTFPRNVFVWDGSIVFKYFLSLPHPRELSLKVLTEKLVLLMSLISGGQRAQTLHCLDVKDLCILQDKIIFPITSKIKQSRPSKHTTPLQFKFYPSDQKLCVVTHLTCYLEQTKDLRSTSKLFISFIKPHKPVSTDTISRWCKNMLKKSGINTDLFSSHSSRSASSSKSKLSGIPINVIMKNAGWSNESVFANYYDKIIIPDVDMLNSIR